MYVSLYVSSYTSTAQAMIRTSLVICAGIQFSDKKAGTASPISRRKPVLRVCVYVWSRSEEQKKLGQKRGVVGFIIGRREKR